MSILVTGSAGFIGFHLTKKLIENGHEVIGIDNLNDYYDLNLKLDRIKILEKISKQKKVNFKLKKLSLQDKEGLSEIFNIFKPKVVFNLAAQAGVRYSLENPNEYIQSNIVGFGNILECCRSNKVENLIYASSSSVYGGNKVMPFKEDQTVDHPVSLYAVTKKSNELMAHSYSHLYKLPVIGLRFFTVFGEWGRPDMVFHKLFLSAFKKKIFQLNNKGNHLRDFTYIGDVVNANILAAQSKRKFQGLVVNIGNGDNKSVNDIAQAVGGKTIHVEPVIEPKETLADNRLAKKILGWKPTTNVIDWINNYLKT